MLFAKRDFSFEVKSVEDDGTFEGYGSVFGEMDSAREIVEKGAFTESLAEMRKKDRPLPILWQHNRDQPIGIYTSVKEDDHGLAMKGRLLTEDVRQAKEAYALLKAKAISGMSIGYITRDSSPDEKERVLRLKKLDLKETSIVTFPANDSARVVAIKAVQAAINSGGLPSLAEFERLLSDSGFTRKQAIAIANGGLKPLLLSDSGEKESSETLVKTLGEFRLPAIF